MTTQLFEGTLETLVGPLVQTFPQLKLATILHSDQLIREMMTNPELRNLWLCTADAALYTMEREGRKDEAILYLGRGETNPVFNDIEVAAKELIRLGNYVPPIKHVEAVKSAESTLRVKLSDLRLERDDPKLRNNEWGYFKIETANYHKLNPEQRRVAERVYGQGGDFEQNMRMFNEAGISETKIGLIE